MKFALRKLGWIGGATLLANEVRGLVVVASIISTLKVFQ